MEMLDNYNCMNSRRKFQINTPVLCYSQFMSCDVNISHYGGSLVNIITMLLYVSKMVS